MRLRKIRTLWLNSLLALCLGWSSLPTQADSTEFNVTEVIKGLGIPWGMHFWTATD